MLYKQQLIECLGLIWVGIVRTKKKNKEKQVYVRHYLFVSITIYPKMLVLYQIGAFILPDKNFKWVFSINMQHSYKSVFLSCVH